MNSIFYKLVSLLFLIKLYSYAICLAAVQDCLQLCNEEGVSVARMVCSGGGVWVSYRGKTVLELFHSTTLKPLQVTDVQTTLTRMTARECAQQRGRKRRSIIESLKKYKYKINKQRNFRYAGQRIQLAESTTI